MAGPARLVIHSWILRAEPNQIISSHESFEPLDVLENHARDLVLYALVDQSSRKVDRDVAICLTDSRPPFKLEKAYEHVASVLQAPFFVWHVFVEVFPELTGHDETLFIESKES